jgi:ferritin-like metal-binding protein YciE
VADVNSRDAKLIQYLNEAYGKEKQLEQALTAHIQMTDLATYKKRLQQHLKETKNHSRQLKSRIRQLGGKAEEVDLPGPDAVGEAASTVANVAGRAVATAQGAVHAVRGTSQQEKLLKNAKDEYHEEAEEIANYTAIETLADTVGDRDTAKLAKAIKREEERMASFLEKLIPRLTKDVAKAEIPAAERRTATASRSRARSTATRARSTASGSAASRSTASRSSGSSSRSGTRASSGRQSTARSSSGSSSARKSSSRSSGGSSRSRSGGSSSRRSSSS